jgi:photosystem II stability/assembly factor-like uncharacterized protein
MIHITRFLLDAFYFRPPNLTNKKMKTNKMIWISAVTALVSLQLQNVSAQSWQEKQSGLASRHGIIDIAAPDIFNAYAMGYDVDNFYGNHLHEVSITHDGGNSWKAQTIQQLADHRITGLGTSSATTIHVIAWNPAYVTGTPGGKVVVSKDGGNTWKQEAVGAFNDKASFPNDISFLNPNDGVMCGDPVNGVFEIYTTKDGGTNWTKVPANKIPAPISTRSLSEMGCGYVMEKFGNTFLTTTIVYDTLGNPQYGRLFESTDKGLSWKVKNANLPINAWDLTMKFRDSNVGLLKNGGKLYKTTNGGTTWAIVNFTGPFCEYDIDDVPGKPQWWISTGGDVISGFTSRKGSSISYDDGKTWKMIDAINHSCVEMVNFSKGYTGGVSSDKKGSKGVYVYSQGLFDIIKSFNEETITEEVTTTLPQLNVFPNPSSQSFSITLNSPTEQFALIRVLNAQGVLVLSERIVPVGTISFGADLTPGVYAAEIIVGGNKNTFQIVKQ